MIDRPANQLDTVEILVETSARLQRPERAAELAAVLAQVERALSETLGVSMEVRLVAPRAVPRSEGKARRVIDRRELTRELAR